MKNKLKAAKIQRQQDIINGAKAAGRELTPEEKAEFDNLQREIEELVDDDSEGGERGLSDQNSNNHGKPDPASDERQRVLTITSLCREFNIAGDVMDGFIRDNKSVDQVRAAILEELKKGKAPISQRGYAEVGADAQDKFRAAAVDALIMRSGMELSKPAEGARDLRGLSLRDLAIECLSMETNEPGLNRKSSDELFTMVMQRQYFNPTAAFPSILDNAIEKAYKEGHKTVAVTFDQWTKKGSLKDFKTHDNYYLAGPVGEFLEVPEDGELKHDKPKEDKLPSRKIKTYGRQFTLSRQAFINDDIDLITKLPARYAASARKTINKMVYEILVKNPAVYDGVALFHNSHKNILASGTGITQAAVQAMIMALQNQTDQFNEAIIIRPAYIIVPSGYAFDMYTLFFSPTINTSDNTQAVNPLFRYKDQIQIIEDPTINVLCGGFGNQMPWWLVGSKEDTDFIEVDYLNGDEIPKIRRMEVPGTLGFVWDIYIDFGINVMDFRGAIKNPGTVINNPLA